MKLNKKLIKQLRNGEIAVENSGTVEQLREVLKAAFPEDGVLPICDCQYYSQSAINTDSWKVYELLDEGKPTFKISDFFQPELFTGWAKDDRFPEWMAYFKDGIPTFGISGEGKWYEQPKKLPNYSQYSHNRPATHEEIQQALIKEAKKRGFKEGVRFRNLNGSIQTIYKTNHWYDENSNSLLCGRTPENEWMEFNCNSNPYLFKDGQWAEIVEQPTQPKPKTNPIKYLVDGIEYSLDYQELKAEFNKVVMYSNEEFMANLPQIAHLACVVAYFKGLGVQATISDKGIIHEIIHLMTDPDEPTNDLGEIREKFNKLIQLV